MCIIKGIAMAMSLGYGSSEEFYFDEYQSLDLHDKRLNVRAKKILYNFKKS